MADLQIPSGTLERALQKGLGCCNSLRPAIEYLENLAVACPEIDPMVTELRLKLEHLDKMCRVGLLHTQQQQPESP